MHHPPSDDPTLRDDLLALIRRGAAGPRDDAGFATLALRVFAHQFAHNRPYRLYCERRGVTPQAVRDWREIPAVPTDAFKAAALVCGDPATAPTVFRTSGTTEGTERRGRHYFPELALYDAALRAGFGAHLLPDGARLRYVSLIPHPAAAPDSSLSHMAGEVARDYGVEGGGWFVSPDGGIDAAGLARALHAAEEDGAAVCVLGTGFAFVHWLDAQEAAGGRFRLPAGSRLMDTGGFKGRVREITRRALYERLTDVLGVPNAWFVNEYGMTEMSSQFYDGTAGTAQDPEARWHAGPPWARTEAADPETLAALPHGEVGVLRHRDLANLHSVAGIQTEDLGMTSPKGFRVLGRARGAEARGCSLAMDDLLTALRNR
jgi:hypothetical protein